jgi:hypothetical protein
MQIRINDLRIRIDGLFSGIPRGRDIISMIESRYVHSEIEEESE